MDFRILGPLEVLDHGGVVPLGGSKQRALLALLVLHANETLSADRLIDELWGERPPATAAKTVQVHVSRLRKALGADATARSSRATHGYELQLEPSCLDAHRFERLVARGPRRARRRAGPSARSRARGRARAVARPAARGPRLRAVRAARGRAARRPAGRGAGAADRGRSSRSAAMRELVGQLER